MASSALTLDTSQMARLIDVTPRQVQSLAAQGILKRARDEMGTELHGRWDMVANNHAYIHYIKRQNRLDDSGDANFVTYRNQRLRAEAEIANLRLKQLRGELLRRDDVMFWIGNALSAFKSRIQAIAPRVTRLILGKTIFQEVYTIIKTETDLGLNELSNLSSGQFEAESAAFLSEQGVEPPQMNGHDENTSHNDDVAGGFADEEARES